MKTSELIARLKELDPSGEMECFIQRQDLFFAPIPDISTVFKTNLGGYTTHYSPRKTGEPVEVISL